MAYKQKHHILENESCFLDPMLVFHTHTPFEEMRVPSVFSMLYVGFSETLGRRECLYDQHG